MFSNNLISMNFKMARIKTCSLLTFMVSNIFFILKIILINKKCRGYKKINLLKKNKNNQENRNNQENKVAIILMMRKTIVFTKVLNNIFAKN